MIENPFLPENDSPVEAPANGSKEILGNVAFKGFLVNILELFVGILGGSAKHKSPTNHAT
ncbi:MAG: hypothetical protein NWR72_16040 [Bacteroidia bacterium]|nr:hypothetical protein [Bacteroidia bacterium]